MDRKILNSYLYNYYKMKSQIEDKKEQIKEIQFVIDSLKSTFGGVQAVNNDGMPHSHNSSSDGIINSIIKRDEQIERLQAQITKLQNDILLYSQVYILITETFNELKNDEKEVFIRSYKDGESRIDIAYFMNYKQVRSVGIKREKICKLLETKLIEAGLN